MTSTPGSTRWRIALKVASVAATGTAISTMSEPETASSADSAAVSMTPSCLRLLGRRRRLAVADDALDQAGALERERERAAHQAATDQAELVEHPIVAQCDVDRIGAEQLEERARARAAPPARRRRSAGRDGPEVDVEVVLPLAGARRPRLEAGHRDAVLLQRHQHVVHRAGPVRDRDDQAGAVVPRGLGLRVPVRVGDDREAGAVVRVVLDRRRDDVQAVLARRALARERGQRRVEAGEARAFGVARDRAALGVRQVVG